VCLAVKPQQLAGVHLEEGHGEAPGLHQVHLIKVAFEIVYLENPCSAQVDLRPEDEEEQDCSGWAAGGLSTSLTVFGSFPALLKKHTLINSMCRKVSEVLIQNCI